MKSPSFLPHLQSHINNALDACLIKNDCAPQNLHQAMRYATLGGGKRIRPILVYLSGQALGSSLEHLDAAACAVELIHSYSLIHDDLPAMDDDDLRRGQASCHKAFGEATAILAGDALQSLAFEILTQQNLPDTIQLAMIKTLAKACGSLGMAGGQALDLAASSSITLGELENIHQLKTAALLKASVKLGALAAQCEENKFIDALEQCAWHLGLAFQIQDDLFDSQEDKSNYTTLASREQTKIDIKKIYDQAISSVSELPQSADQLRYFTHWLAQRES
ncbi:MAG: farnesyl diphosphate synthase [Gammaproteobacteria bacterium]